MAGMQAWQMRGTGYEFCNCDFGCGSNFGGFPNSKDGSCRALVGMHIADGESGGTRGAQTFVLIANTSATAGRVRITQLPDSVGPLPAAPVPTITVDIPANSRTTVPLSGADTVTARPGGTITSPP